MSSKDDHGLWREREDLESYLLVLLLGGSLWQFGRYQYWGAQLELALALAGEGSEAAEHIKVAREVLEGSSVGLSTLLANEVILEAKGGSSILRWSRPRR